MTAHAASHLPRPITDTTTALLARAQDTAGFGQSFPQYVRKTLPKC